MRPDPGDRIRWLTLLGTEMGVAFEAPDLPARMAWAHAQRREPGSDGR